MLPRAQGLSHQQVERNVITDDEVIVDGKVLAGVDAEAFRKLELKRNRELERQIASWVAEVTGEKVDIDDPIESFRSGIILIKLINIIRPNTIPKYNTRNIPLLEMENIGFYLQGCWSLGVPSSELFVTSDLYRRKGEPQVYQNLESVARIAIDTSTFKGPLPRFAVGANRKLKSEEILSHKDFNAHKQIEDEKKRRYEAELKRMKEQEERNRELLRKQKEEEENRLREKLQIQADEELRKKVQELKQNEERLMNELKKIKQEKEEVIKEKKEEIKKRKG